MERIGKVNPAVNYLLNSCFVGKADETVRWIGNWLLCVSQFLEREYDSSSASLQKIRKSVLFPLSNGEIVNLMEKAVFFPFQNRRKSSKASEGKVIIFYPNCCV